MEDKPFLTRPRGLLRTGKYASILLNLACVAGTGAFSQQTPPPSPTPFDLVLKKAQSGDPDAQARLASLYYVGDGIPQDFAEAEKWARRASDQGNPNGTYQLALLYQNGRGVAKDKVKALTLVGKAAKAGQPEAELWLADSYLKGTAKKQYYDQALLWYARAAQQGSSAGEVGIGNMYSNGWGVEQNCSQAALWFQKAVDRKDFKANLHLANLYWLGKGVPQDKNRAADLIRGAADAGDSDAIAVMGASYDNFGGDDPESGVRLLRRAAELGNAYGQYSLGNLYWDGINVKQDYSQAKFWLQKAADQGQAGAERLLGVLYYRGYGVEQNRDQFLYWVKLASDQNDVAGMKELGRYYALGYHDYERGEEWFEKANIQKMFNERHIGCEERQPDDTFYVPNTNTPLQWRTNPDLAGIQVGDVCLPKYGGKNEAVLMVKNNRPWLIELHIQGDAYTPKHNYSIRVLGPGEWMGIGYFAVKSCKDFPTVKFEIAYDVKNDTAKLEYSRNDGLKIQRDHHFDILGLMQATLSSLDAAVQAREDSITSQQNLHLIHQVQDWLTQVQSTRSSAAATHKMEIESGDDEVLPIELTDPK